MYIVGFGFVSLIYIPIVLLLFESKASKMYRVEQTL